MPGMDGLPVQVDHLSYGCRGVSGQPHRCRRPRYAIRRPTEPGPGCARVPRVDVTVNEQCIPGERVGLPAQHDQNRANHLPTGLSFMYISRCKKYN